MFDDIPQSDEHGVCRAEVVKLMVHMEGASELLTRCLETGALDDAELLEHMRSWFEQLDADDLGEESTEH